MARRTRGAARRIVAASVVTAVTVWTFATSAAVAAPGDPVRGRGTVTSVPDGDTVRVRLQGQSGDPLIRLAGIQAFETGECGADIAAARLRQLVEGRQVTLRARDAGSRSDGRPVRSLHLGATDVTERMLRDGMGLWFPLAPEVTDTARYHRAATEARLARRGIWDPTLCGTGPQPGHPIDLWVKSDADGDDSRNVNDEYVRIVNRGSSPLDLSRWTLRESSQVRRGDQGIFRFPAGTVVPAGARVRVNVGRGSDTTTTFHMGSPSPLFDNADVLAGIGDGAYLQDPRGNVRAAFTYPCVLGCSDPRQDQLRISHVEYDPPGVDTADTEYVEIRNVGSSRVAMDGLQLRKRPYAHEFAADSFLDPGETMRVWVGRGTQSRLVQHWGDPGRIQGRGANNPVLTNAGDAVDLLTWDEIRLDCRSWGDGRCFVDTPGTAHAANVERLVRARVTDGLSDGTFRPGRQVSREQMASFLARALGLSPVPGTRFRDVPAGGVHAGSINAIVDAGITRGFDDGTFRPTQPVTRAQMATFLAQAAELRPIPGRRFGDVDPTSPHAGTINAVVQAGIARGTGGSTYSPGQRVTRGQMATFLVELRARR